MYSNVEAHLKEIKMEILYSQRGKTMIAMIYHVSRHDLVALGEMLLSG
jgi:hypothetical protein